MLIKVSTLKEFRTERDAANANGDCAVRAFATFFDVDYDTAREEINVLNAKDCVRGTQFTALEAAIFRYANKRGIEITFSRPRNKVKVSRLARLVEKALVIASGHATTVMNGAIYGNTEKVMERGDDSNQYVKGYWTMQVTDINKYLQGNV